MSDTFTILCIDDDEDTLFIAQLSLELDQTIVMTAVRSGEEALRLLGAGEQRFDCILLDAQMPTMSGAELLPQIRAVAGYADTPVIFLTASVRAHDLRAYLALGARGMIAKPFDPLMLASQVRRLVAQG